MTEQEFLSTLAGMDNPAMSAFGEAMISRMEISEKRAGELESQLATMNTRARVDAVSWERDQKELAALKAQVAKVIEIRKQDNEQAQIGLNRLEFYLAQSREEVRGLREALEKIEKRVGPHHCLPESDFLCCVAHRALKEPPQAAEAEPGFCKCLVVHAPTCTEERAI